MKVFCFIFIVSMLTYFVPGTFAQAVKGDEIVNVKGQKYIVHKAQRRETPYFIAKKYGISIDDIYTYNPGIKRLRKGDVIRIPQWKKETIVIDTTPKVIPLEKPTPRFEDAIVHRVKPGETLYSISKMYNTTISEILFYNPDATNPRIGMEIRLPQYPIHHEETTPVIEKVGDYFLHTIEDW